MMPTTGPFEAAIIEHFEAASGGEAGVRTRGVSA